VIDEWLLLLEYAVCYLPCNPDTLVEAVSKGAVELPADLARALGIDADLLTRPPTEPRPSGSGPKAVSFTPLTEVEKTVTAAIASVDFAGIARTAAETPWERARGRVCGSIRSGVSSFLATPPVDFPARMREGQLIASDFECSPSDFFQRGVPLAVNLPEQRVDAFECFVVHLNLQHISLDLPLPIPLDPRLVV
jgi:hypothetical protein